MNSNDTDRFGGQKEMVIERDGQRCVVCSMTRVEHKRRFKRDITVDHIDGQGRYTSAAIMNNDPNNLQTLCLVCHGKKDGRRAVPFKGEQHYRAKITTNQAANIRHMRGSVSTNELAKWYGLSRSTINSIQSGRIWKTLLEGGDQTNVNKEQQV